MRQSLEQTEDCYYRSFNRCMQSLDCMTPTYLRIVFHLFDVCSCIACDVSTSPAPVSKGRTTRVPAVSLPDTLVGPHIRKGGWRAIRSTRFSPSCKWSLHSLAPDSGTWESFMTYCCATFSFNFEYPMCLSNAIHIYNSFTGALGSLHAVASFLPSACKLQWRISRSSIVDRRWHLSPYWLMFDLQRLANLLRPPIWR